jgi:hypothetical protein
MTDQFNEAQIEAARAGYQKAWATRFDNDLETGPREWMLAALLAAAKAGDRADGAMREAIAEKIGPMLRAILLDLGVASAREEIEDLIHDVALSASLAAAPKAPIAEGWLPNIDDLAKALAELSPEQASLVLIKAANRQKSSPLTKGEKP